MPRVKTQTLPACVASLSYSQRKKGFPRLPFRRWAAKGTTASRLRLSTVSCGITETSQSAQYGKISRKDAKKEERTIKELQEVSDPIFCDLLRLSCLLCLSL